jgi:hypothetical protein
VVNKSFKESLGDVILADVEVFFHRHDVKKTDRFLARGRGIGLRVSRGTLPGPVKDQTNAMFAREFEVIDVEEVSDVRAEV